MYIEEQVVTVGRCARSRVAFHRRPTERHIEMIPPIHLPRRRHPGRSVSTTSFNFIKMILTPGFSSNLATSARTNHRQARQPITSPADTDPRS